MEHLIVQLGALLGACAILAILLDKIRQSSILAFISVGVIAKIMGMEFPEHVIHAFSETGIILLLFMAGLEVDIKSFLDRWKMVATIGVGQIALNTLLGVLLAMTIIDTEDMTTIFYFGLCLTFSSTIIVLGLLKTRKEMESLHGQLLLGLLVMQDITAVVALAVLASLQSGESFGPAIGMLAVKMVGLAGILYVLSRFVLKGLFRKLAKSSDLLFLGTLGWAMGIAAACESIHFSPEIGAFMAGVAVGVLPYRLEIEDKVEPLKSFGVVLFFVSLGFGLVFDENTLTFAGPVAAVVGLTVVGTLPLMILLGYIARLKSRTAFLMGGIINQISEFSLILATLCLQANVFTQDQFMIITLACVVTIVLSGIGHQLLETAYGASRALLQFLDDHAAGGAEHGEMEGHVVMFGYNELSNTICRLFITKGHAVVHVDLDPRVHELLANQNDEKIHPLYADMYDPDTWEDTGMARAALVVSCVKGCQEAELAMLRWLGEHAQDSEEHPAPAFIAATHSNSDALELYEAGATFVIQNDALAAQHMEQVLQETAPHELSAHGSRHRGVLEELRAAAGEEFQYS